jgi:hypothetical protein
MQATEAAEYFNHSLMYDSGVKSEDMNANRKSAD